MSEQINQHISKAVVVIPSEPGIDVFKTRYGGETLLGRSLIVLSKSDIRDVLIIGPAIHRKSIDKAIQSVRQRLKFEFHVVETNAGESLMNALMRATGQWNENFILLDCGKIIHPTLISQMTVTNTANPVLFAFKDVWIDKGQVRYSSKIKNKFKVMFQDVRSFKKITMNAADRERIIQSDYSAENVVFFVADAGANTDGFFSTQILVCRTEHLKEVSASDHIQDIIQALHQQGRLRLNWAEPAWWLPITSEQTQSHIREFFWRIAFKEISGEFSKAVNSHLSKPMTFLLVSLRFTPNVISVIEIVLFLLASSFLFIAEYWGMIVFAVIWQLSAGVLDRCDGEVARMRNYESASGARFDMLIDDLRFAIPLVVLGYVCWNEQSMNWFYPAVLGATILWYIPAALYQQYYMRKAGYVSIQALGVDLLKSLEDEVSPDGFFNRYRFLLKGDIRTFYVFLLSFTGYKPVIFIVLALYEWLVGLTNLITVQKMKRVMKNKIQSH